MTRRAALPKISECIEPMPRATSFTEGRMLQAVMLFVIVTVLCLAHIHLRFLCTDMRLQQSGLQRKHRELLQTETQLLRQNEALCDRNRLAMVAQRESMKEVDVREQVVAVVPASLVKKYGEMPATETDFAIARVERTRAVGERLVGFLDMSRAYAGLPER